jgi:hypothetical protein
MSLPDFSPIQQVSLKNCHRAGHPPTNFKKGVTEYMVRLEGSGHWRRVYFDNESIAPNNDRAWYFVKLTDGSKIQIIFPNDFFETAFKKST